MAHIGDAKRNGQPTLRSFGLRVRNFNLGNIRGPDLVPKLRQAEALRADAARRVKNAPRGCSKELANHTIEHCGLAINADVPVEEQVFVIGREVVGVGFDQKNGDLIFV